MHASTTLYIKTTKMRFSCMRNRVRSHGLMLLHERVACYPTSCMMQRGQARCSDRGAPTYHHLDLCSSKIGPRPDNNPESPAAASGPWQTRPPDPARASV